MPPTRGQGDLGLLDMFNTPLKILIVDDHLLVVQALSYALSAMVKFDVVACTDVLQLRDVLEKQGPFQVTLQDINMPGMSGIASYRELVKQEAAGRIILFSAEYNAGLVNEALKAGCYGFVPKSMSLTGIAAAINVVASGEKFMPVMDSSSQGSNRGRIEGNVRVSASDVKVLAMISGGKTNKEIAFSMGLTEAAVKMRVRKIVAQLKASNRTHAVVIARELGYL